MERESVTPIREKKSELALRMLYLLLAASQANTADLESINRPI
jgi:hypothetical protein